MPVLWNEDDVPEGWPQLLLREWFERAHLAALEGQHPRERGRRYGARYQLVEVPGRWYATERSYYGASGPEVLVGPSVGIMD